MILPLDDLLIDEKNRIQQQMLKEANGDMSEYSRLVHRETEKLREEYMGKFLTRIE